MSFVRNLIGAALRRALSPRWYRILRHPALVPGEYRRFIDEIERVRDMVTSDHGLDEEYWAAVLRKHAHIIDKGLQRQDCSPGHSAAHYNDAIEALSHIHSAEMRDDPSVKWATEKVKQYESLQRGDLSRECGKPPIGDVGSYEMLLKIIKERRSARSFLYRPIDEQMIQQVVESANWAPQSCNRQPIKVFCTNNESHVHQCMEITAGATCFGVHVPCFMSFCADLRPYSLPGEIWLPYVDLSLGAQNCCLIAQTMGLSITLLSWCQSGPYDESRLRRVLEIPDNYVIGFNAAMGYPEHLGEPPARKGATLTCMVRSGE